MPKLRLLSGDDIVKTLNKFGFVIVHQRGSHAKLVRVLLVGKQSLTVHMRKALRRGTTLDTFRQACVFIAEAELRPYFFHE